MHAAFLPFGDIKDVSVPLDQGTQKNRGFGFVTFQEACVPVRARAALARLLTAPATATTPRRPWTTCITQSCTAGCCAATTRSQ